MWVGVVKSGDCVGLELGLGSGFVLGVLLGFWNLFDCVLGGGFRV